jgi:serine/threonine protein kinase/tetratricopeptide (TPR) repeat protein
MIGQTLSHYKILDKLGEGGMGEVYLAEDTTLGRQVALKVLPADLASSPERLERFQREARAVAALNHPNIVTLHSVEEADGTHFLTMEYVEGQSLDHLIASGGLELDRFLELAVSLAQAMAAAHAKGITHRDLKPANVMVTEEGQVKVLDFGLAKIQESADFAPTQLPTEGLTGEGVVMGTAWYMSPEQAEGKPLDHRTDIFSLGVVLYEMTTGQRPFEGDSPVAVMGSILRDQPTPVFELRPDLPRHLDRIVSACLEKQPEDRFQSSRDVYNGLRQLKQEVTSDPARTSAVPAPSAPQRSRSRWPAIGMGIAVVALVALAAWWAASTRSAPETEPLTAGPPSQQSDRKMIAVLPLRNVGAPEDEFFAAGITDEILSRLASVRGLGVVSTGGSSPYRDQVRARAIGQDLGVDYILTGSVRWAPASEGSSRVRISPRLIRVEDETHVWAEVYDRSIEDIFEIQSEIALNVVRELNAALLEPERQTLEARPTDNPEAYQAYLRGIFAADSVACAFIRERIGYLHRATELDPGFVEAWAYASRAHSAAFAHCPEHAEEDRLEALRTLERVKSLAPDSWLALEAEGKFLTQVERDYVAALEPLKQAAQLVERWETYFSLGRIYRRMGDWDRALEASERALELNPRNPELVLRVAAVHHWMRHYPEALDYYDRSIELAPEWNNSYLRKAWVHWLWRADLVSARVTLEALPPDEPSPNIQWAWFWQRIYEGRTDAAIEGLEALADDQMFSSVVFVEPKELLQAQALELMGERQRAEQAYDKARQRLEPMIESAPESQSLLQALALTYAGLDLAEDAEGIVLRLKELVPFETDPYFGSSVLQISALVHAKLGRYDTALQELDTILAVPGVISIPILELDPRWQPLRAQPGFAKLAEKYGSESTP